MKTRKHKPLFYHKSWSEQRINTINKQIASLQEVANTAIDRINSLASELEALQAFLSASKEAEKYMPYEEKEPQTPTKPQIPSK